MQKKKIINILGSTGSIGRSAFEILKNNIEKFEVQILLGFQNWELILLQSKILKPKMIFVSFQYIQKIIDGLFDFLPDVKIFATEDFRSVLNFEHLKISDITLLSVKGFVGLKFCLDIIPFSKRVCLANKEAVVCGGEVLLKEIKKYNCELLPVDSEHNTIFQILENLKNKDQLKEIVITASGGPFLKQILSNNLDELKNVTFEQAVLHPKWKMGPEISINSATLMNKAHELIEAFYLFGTKNLKAIIHPEHLIHGIVNLKNGMSFFGASHPDMKLHIAHSFFYETEFETLENCGFLNLNLPKEKQMNFFEIQNWPFDFVEIAYEIISKNDLQKSIVLNALNEVALDLFLKRKIKFLEINDFILKNLERFKNFSQPVCFEEIFEIDELVRIDFNKLLN